MAITLRLLLGDQLNPQHSWFRETRNDVVYVLMELRQETDYVLHHAQKIIAIFAAMRDFARHLGDTGHRMHYFKITDPANCQFLTSNLDALVARYQACAIEYQEPDEWRLDKQLTQYAALLTIPCRMVSSEHFYTMRDELARQFAGRQKWLLEHFYRSMRLRHRILLDGPGKPAGGKWNYDHHNRKRWNGSPAEPADDRAISDHSLIWRDILKAGIKSFGVPNAAHMRWPVNRAQALWQLDAFIRHSLPHFGNFQDAMSSTATRLFHSQLSFALNTKMLNPREVVARVERAWTRGRAPLAATEGFIRQIVGWREYVRGVYWAQMPGYVDQNALDHKLPLPTWFWTGQTKMNCLAHAIGQSLELAHAHHIQRLMIIGNFALLAGLDPAQVHRWYLGIYVDAFEWVEAPNTLGMSQYADGGLMSTKPYVSSAAYIARMSDFCDGCYYDRKQREGERACPFNALYWDFFALHADKLSGNPRLRLTYRQMKDMGVSTLRALRTQASELRERLDTL